MSSCSEIKVISEAQHGMKTILILFYTVDRSKSIMSYYNSPERVKYIPYILR